MAVPFFIFAGNLMNETGLTNRIFNFAKALVGHIRGGLAQVNILDSMIFAGISGSFVGRYGRSWSYRNEGHDASPVTTDIFQRQ